jgi:hypothetical protein
MCSTDSEPNPPANAGITAHLGLNAASSPACHSAYARASGASSILSGDAVCPAQGVRRAGLPPGSITVSELPNALWQ